MSIIYNIVCNAGYGADQSCTILGARSNKAAAENFALGESVRIAALRTLASTYMHRVAMWEKKNVELLHLVSQEEYDKKHKAECVRLQILLAYNEGDLPADADSGFYVTVIPTKLDE